MEKTMVLTESRYIKPSREAIAFSYVSTAFFFTLYVLPQYFGVPFPLFDFTVLRIMIITMLLLVLGTKRRQQEFFKLISKAPYSKVLVPYLLVLIYTTVLRVDVNAFLNPVIEIISFYLLIYIIKDSFGIKKTFEYIIIFAYILTILGLLEYVMQRSPFSYLEIIDGLSSGRYIRSGYYRIMSSANHALGYGLILITIVPIICFDIEKDEINVMRRKFLFVMIAINVFLTGSRSTLSIFILEVFMLAMVSTRTNKKRLILIGSLFIAIIVAFLTIFQQTAIAQYAFLQIFSVLDEVLGTSYSISYGADLTALGDSSNYRDQLKYIFQVDWLNPFLGIGRSRSFASEINGSYIISVDSFYIAEYIRYAYPGMICYIVFLLYFLLHMLANSIKKKSQISKMLFIGSLCYCINILWLDSLQTLKYLYILFAIFCCLPEHNPVEAKIREQVRMNRG